MQPLANWPLLPQLTPPGLVYGECPIKETQYLLVCCQGPSVWFVTVNDCTNLPWQYWLALWGYCEVKFATPPPILINKHLQNLSQKAYKPGFPALCAVLTLYCASAKKYESKIVLIYNSQKTDIVRPMHLCHKIKIQLPKKVHQADTPYL